MEYFQVNYSKLLNLKQINFYKLIIIIFCIFILIIVCSLNIKVFQKVECYGIFKDNILNININSKLSDKIKSSKYIIFNDKKIYFKINKYGNYELLNDEIYQDIELSTDKKFYDNEIGIVKFYYGKKSVFKYILDLFK